MTEATVRMEPLKEHVSKPRIDAFERVMGAAKYAADWKKDDMLYARIVKSSIPHGNVKKIDSEEASRTPGFVDLVTCFDDRTIWAAGEREHQRRVFTERVRFIGDCIGAVTATDRYSAEKASQMVDVQYEELPGSFTVESSMKDDAPKIWEEGNILGPLEYGYGNADEYFSRASHIIERHYSTSRMHNAPLEPAISLAWWDGDHLTVVAATQSVHGCRNGIARDLGLPPEKVRVISYYKGGGFGNKINSMNYDLIAAICSRRTGKPVMVEYSREDEFLNVHGRWSSEQDIRIAADSEGKISAFDVRAVCDIGAYTRHIKRGMFIEGPEHYYSTEAWKASIKAVYTNSPATGHMRAPPGPQSAFASETIVDELASELGMDPVETRLKNYARKTHSGEFTSSGFEECILKGSEAFDWKHRWNKPMKPQGRRGIATGVGMAISSWHSGVGYGEAIVTVQSGGKAIVNTGVVDIGTGAKTTMALIGSKALGIPYENVQVVWGDTDTSPFSVGESGSRTTNYTGNAVKEAALKVRDEILTDAARLYGLNKNELNISNGNIIHTTDEMHLGTIWDVMKQSGKEIITKEEKPEPTLKEGEERFCFAAHFAEVAVDLETGEVKVTDYLAAHESGEIVNQLTAESQVQGGIVMGLGMALTEKLIISDSNGAIENPSFLLYRLPNMTHIPNIKVKFIDSVDPYGPKSLGEIPILPVTAAVGNAIFNATGVRLRGLPFSREELLEGLNTK